MIFDEFYSHYIYEPGWQEGDANSAARFVEDVNTDPVLVVDGLTKNWRYPGLRVSWTLGPASVIEAVASAGSFLDGGAPHPVQQAAVPLLSLDHAVAEARSIQREFVQKRDLIRSVASTASRRCRTCDQNCAMATRSSTRASRRR